MDQYKYEFSIYEPDQKQKKLYNSKELDIISVIQNQMKISLQHLNPLKLQRIHFKKKPKIDLQKAVIAIQIIFYQNLDIKWKNIKLESEKLYLKMLNYPEILTDRYQVFINRAKKVLYENDPLIMNSYHNFIIYKPNQDVELTSYNAVINFAYCMIALYEIVTGVNNQVVYEDEQENLLNERLKTEQTTEREVKQQTDSPKQSSPSGKKKVLQTNDVRKFRKSRVKPLYLRSVQHNQDEKLLQNQRIFKIKQEITLLLEEIKQHEQKMAMTDLNDWILVREQKLIESKQTKLMQMDDILRYEQWRQLQHSMEKVKQTEEKQYIQDVRNFRSELSQEKRKNHSKSKSEEKNSQSFSQHKSNLKSKSPKSKSPKSKSPKSKSPKSKQICKSQEQLKVNEIKKQQNQSAQELEIMRKKFESLNDKL